MLIARFSALMETDGKKTCGVVHLISARSNNMRVMGGAFSLLPVARAAVIFTKLRLMGIPFFAAFYSKEMVLERLRSSGSTAGVSYVLIVAGVGLTVAYSGR